MCLQGEIDKLKEVIIRHYTRDCTILSEESLNIHTKLYTTNIGNIIVQVEADPIHLDSDLKLTVSLNGAIKLRELYVGSEISLDKSISAIYAIFNTLNGEEDYNGNTRTGNGIIYS